tara:strand:+ start:2205 stop:2909 length:705 start_codon:yes stop_codon:yes gene_type:complete
MPLLKRISTGIPGFDELVKGGFREKSVNLICGPAGSGKSIFALQFLINGLKNSNEKAIYITFEEDKEHVYSNMLNLGWDLKKLEKNGMFTFLQYAPEMVRELISQGESGAFGQAIQDSKSKRLVIDSISSFSLLYEKEYERKRACVELFELIRNWGFTALFTAEDELVSESSISTELDFEADSMIFLYNFKAKGKRKRALEVYKMRGTGHVRSVLGFDIKKKGIIVNPNDVVVF